MPVTEFSLLHFDPSVITLDEIKPVLRDAKLAMESYSQYPFYYYIQAADDVTFIYIIGAWDSLEQHYDDWIISNENKVFLERLKGKVDVEWLFHLSLDYTENEASTPFGAPVISVSRFIAKPGQKQAIDEAIAKDMMTALDIQPGEAFITYGWRLDLGYDKEEIRDIVKCPPPHEELCLFSDIQETIFSSTEATERSTSAFTRRASPLFASVETKHALRWNM
ncbi:hypothetical protein KEM54_003866 [Ascosphaera aggregata]|nr:hypothetical protein KEM54_003866 [Ascosphaera aggregata]